MPQERQIAGRPPLIESRRAVEVLQRQLVERDAKRWASVPAASTMVLPYLAEVVTVTGSATIAAITPDQGREVTLIFAATSTVQNSASVKLAGGVSYVGGAGNTLTLACDNGVWRESGRNDGTVGGSGAPGPPGPAGPTGPTGPAGADGADGDDGVLAVYEQDAAPTEPIEAGSIWLDTDAAPPAPIERAVTYSTTFPSAPATGDIHFYPMGQGIWQFVWDEWDVAWYFVGGPPLCAEQVAAQNTTSTSYVSLSGALSLTIPVAGDYDIEIQAGVLGQGGLNSSQLSYAVGATAASDNWSTSVGFLAAMAAVVKRTRWTGVAASAAVVEKARTTTGTATYEKRRLLIWPVKHA